MGVVSFPDWRYVGCAGSRRVKKPSAVSTKARTSRNSCACVLIALMDLVDQGPEPGTILAQAARIEGIDPCAQVLQGDLGRWKLQE